MREEMYKSASEFLKALTELVKIFTKKMKEESK
jgi:hypothetical protein